MKQSKNLKTAFIVGIIPAILEGVLVYSVEPSINGWILFQATLFWFTCGVTVHLLDIGIPRIVQGIIFTVFLNLPWYIAESVAKNKPEHFIPLVVASVIFGTIIGLTSKKLHTSTLQNEVIQ